MPLTGMVHYEGDPFWEEARRGYNNRFQGKPPHAIVFCEDVQDVQNAVKEARDKGWRLRVRCGRHDYEGWSSGSDMKDRNWLLVDVSQMEGVKYVREPGKPPTEVIVEPGLEMNLLAELLWDAGVCLPQATGPSVGLAGLVLAGGFGPTSRKHGLTCDNLLGVEMVDARGNRVVADKKKNPDLLWACKGGGGGLGIVTRLRFRVHEVKHAGWFYLVWEWPQFEKVVDTWQHWNLGLSDEVSSALRLQSGKDVKDRQLVLYGTYLPDPDKPPFDLPALLKPIASVRPLKWMGMYYGTFAQATRSGMGGDPNRPAWLIHEHATYEKYKASSAFATTLLDDRGIRTLKECVEKAPEIQGKARPEPGLRKDVPIHHMIQLLGGGGEFARLDPEATAMWYRKSPFLLQYDGYWSADQDESEVIKWVRNTRKALLDWSEGAYVGYLDRDRSLRDYFGENLERLLEVKNKYDPEDFFQASRKLSMVQSTDRR